MTLHGQEINIGDEVFDLGLGNGVVLKINPDIFCEFEHLTQRYDSCGVPCEPEGYYSQPTLHFPGVTVIPGKKKVKTKVWDWVFYTSPSGPLCRQPYLQEGLTELEKDAILKHGDYFQARRVEGTEREVNA